MNASPVLGENSRSIGQSNVLSARGRPSPLKARSPVPAYVQIVPSPPHGTSLWVVLPVSSGPHAARAHTARASAPVPNISLPVRPDIIDYLPRRRRTIASASAVPSANNSPRGAEARLPLPPSVHVQPPSLVTLTGP